jgi:hypothetical protein
MFISGCTGQEARLDQPDDQECASDCTEDDTSDGAAAHARAGAAGRTRLTSEDFDWSLFVLLALEECGR